MAAWCLRVAKTNGKQTLMARHGIGRPWRRAARGRQTHKTKPMAWRVARRGMVARPWQNRRGALNNIMFGAVNENNSIGASSA